MATGTIKSVNRRGFGFIKPDSDDPDVFFHASQLNGLEFDERLRELRVEFEIVDGPKGPSAVNVRAAQ